MKHFAYESIGIINFNNFAPPQIHVIKYSAKSTFTLYSGFIHLCALILQCVSEHNVYGICWQVLCPGLYEYKSQRDNTLMSLYWGMTRYNQYWLFYIRVSPLLGYYIIAGSLPPSPVVQKYPTIFHLTKGSPFLSYF